MVHLNLNLWIGVSCVPQSVRLLTLPCLAQKRFPHVLDIEMVVGGAGGMEGGRGGMSSGSLIWW
jgi:hypothetical protein